MYWTLELASKLEDAPWPATKEELIDYAIRSGAPLEVLENLQDPGNLGTMLRSGEGAGVTGVILSKGCADIYNPKAVQATMGAIARVRIHYTDLAKELTALPDLVPVYGTFLEGDIIYDTTLSANGVIIMGNEGNGISKEVGKTVNRKLFIPAWPAGAATSESLNVAIATAIVCSEFRRRCGNA